MPPRPNGKNEQAERVTFTKPAAERIGKVVRIVEAGDRSSSGAAWGVRLESARKVFRVATFTGAWSINTPKVLTYYNVTTTPNTVSVQNVLFPLPSLSTTTSNPTSCVIAKDGTAWYLVNVVHSGHDILTGASLTPSDLQFTRRNGMSISTAAATTGISASSCDTQASAAQLSSFLG